MGFWSSIFETKPAPRHKPRKGSRSVQTTKARVNTPAVGRAAVAASSRGRPPIRSSAGKRVTPMEHDSSRNFPGDREVRQSPRARFAGVTSDRRMDERIRYGAGQLASPRPGALGQPGRSTPKPEPSGPSFFGWRPIGLGTSVGRARGPARPLPGVPGEVGASMRYPRQTGGDYDRRAPIRPGRM